MIQNPSAEFIAGCTFTIAALGFAVRHFAPLVLKKSFWRYQRVENGDNEFMTAGQHRLLCVSIKERLAQGEITFSSMESNIAQIAKEIRYLRSIVVMQSPPEILRKAAEIEGS